MQQQNTLAQVVPLSLRRQYVSMVSPHVKAGDFKITLTFPDTYKIDPVMRSKDVKHFVRLANIGLLGTQYRKHGRRLNCVYVFELNEYQTAIHLHMALENPQQACLSEEEKLPFLRKSWAKMRCSGPYAANEFEYVEDEGWVGYMFKDINPRTDVMADVTGWTLNNRG